MIKQNDKECLPVVQRIGCLVRTSGAMAEFVTGKELTASQINDLWTWGKKSGHINVEDNVKHSAPIATKALQMLGGEGQFIEIATFNKGKMNYYGSVTEEMKKLPKYYIQKIKTNGPVGTHFINVSFDGILLFDPHEPAINSQGVFYTIVFAYKKG